MNYSTESVRLAAAYIAAVKAALRAPVSSQETLIRANKALLSAATRAQCAGLDPDELVVLAAASGHPYAPQWAKDYTTRQDPPMTAP